MGSNVLKIVTPYFDVERCVNSSLCIALGFSTRRKHAVVWFGFCFPQIIPCVDNFSLYLICTHADVSIRGGTTPHINALGSRWTVDVLWAPEEHVWACGKSLVFLFV